jgi:hypothetical protein
MSRYEANLRSVCCAICKRYEPNRALINNVIYIAVSDIEDQMGTIKYTLVCQLSIDAYNHQSNKIEMIK